MIKHLLEKGSDVNETYKDNDITPLDIAIYTGKKEIVSILLDNGADISGNKLDASLEMAKRKGYTEIIQIINDRKSR